MIKLIAILLEPFMPRITKKLIDVLLWDNDRLNQEWKKKYAEMEAEKWYWYDRFMDTVYEPDTKD